MFYRYWSHSSVVGIRGIFRRDDCYWLLNSRRRRLPEHAKPIATGCECHNGRACRDERRRRLRPPSRRHRSRLRLRDNRPFKWDGRLRHFLRVVRHFLRVVRHLLRVDSVSSRRTSSRDLLCLHLRFDCLRSVGGWFLGDLRWFGFRKRVMRLDIRRSCAFGRIWRQRRRH